MDTDVAADDAVVNIVGRFVEVVDIWLADIPLGALLQSKILKGFPLSIGHSSVVTPRHSH